MKIFIPLLLSFIITITIDNLALRLIHAGQLPTIKQIYGDYGAQKEVDVSLPPGSKGKIEVGSKGKVYFLDDDKEESIIADIKVVSIRTDGIAHAEITGQSASILIKKGHFVKFLPPPQVPDTVAPAGSININNNAVYTNSRTVTLLLSATDNIGIIGYYISPNPVTPSANASGWQSVASSKSYTENITYPLDSGEGNKVIYIWYKDVAVNMLASANDSIILDTTAPTITITSPTSDSTYTTITSTISIGGNASDNVSGISSVRCSNSDGDSWPVNGTTNWSIPGIKLQAGNNSITITAKDNAGHASTDTITVFYKLEDDIMGKVDCDNVIAIVNGEKIFRQDLDKILNRFRNHVNPGAIKSIEEQITEQLITQILLKQFVVAKKLTVSNEMVEAEIVKMRNNIRNNTATKDKTLEEFLELQGSNIEELRMAITMSSAIESYVLKNIEGQKLEEYFANNMSNFNGETVTASHILIETKNMKTKEELDEAKAKIYAIKKELEHGADFAMLAKKYSDCPTGKTGGSLGAFPRHGAMVEDFAKAAFATEAGKVSDPVKAEFGYHLIKVTARTTAKGIRFSEVKDKVREELVALEMNNLIKGLREKAKIEITP